MNQTLSQTFRETV